jgi:hypothetical protein
MLAQLEVKEINSRTLKDFYWFSMTFQSGNFFSKFKNFPGFQRPSSTPCYYWKFRRLMDIAQRHILIKIWKNMDDNKLDKKKV